MEIVFDIKKQENKNADIGDIVRTEKDGFYLILDCSEINHEYYKAICNIKTNKIEFFTAQESMYAGGDLYGEKISHVIDKDDFKLVINKFNV